MLGTRIPQSTKQKLCILMEKLLAETKNYQGFKYLYWSRYGCLDWEEAKSKADNAMEGVDPYFESLRSKVEELAKK